MKPKNDMYRVRVRFKYQTIFFCWKYFGLTKFFIFLELIIKRNSFVIIKNYLYNFSKHNY